MDYKAAFYAVLLVATMSAILTSTLIYPMVAIVGLVAFMLALAAVMLYMVLTTP